MKLKDKLFVKMVKTLVDRGMPKARALELVSHTYQLDYQTLDILYTHSENQIGHK